jgi:hypothetical protein
LLPQYFSFWPDAGENAGIIQLGLNARIFLANVELFKFHDFHNVSAYVKLNIKSTDDNLTYLS